MSLPAFGTLDPRSKIVRGEFEVLDKVHVKNLRANLIEDQFSPQAGVALRLARDSYNKKVPMHLMLDLARFNSAGQLWLASVEATQNAALLEAHKISHVWPAAYQKKQTRDTRFYFLPCMDGTGIIKGSVAWEAVLENLVQAAQNLLKGYRYVICCRNGAHRSAMLLGLLLMMMTGMPAEHVEGYMVRLRSLVDLRSPPPHDRSLGTSLAFMNTMLGSITKARQRNNLPAIGLNPILNSQQYLQMFQMFALPRPVGKGSQTGSSGKGSQTGSMRPAEPEGPPPSKAARKRVKGKGKGKAASLLL